MRVYATDIVVMPGTEIGGDLVYTCDKELVLDEKVQLPGQLLRKEVQQPSAEIPQLPPMHVVIMNFYLFVAALMVGIPFAGLLALAGVARGDYYVSLGKIDDIDDVYLNGKHIGSVYDLRKDGDYRRSGWEYNARRLYKIPAGLLKADAPNVLAVRVYDGQMRGGIFEGPIGIMSAENYKRYRNKYFSTQPFWDSIFDMFNIN